ncbi:MAG: DUF2125 domain-containing protein [Alphaproteobacteria bacterium]|nr:DUF2125 domain-containing protein [Alphaproteobacteria bacterium]MDE2109790.1 DUF2125 domain-containing protein [Alphaproteobacteria bacterium]MDE2495677.1 DUF2125 domain-containing protein [Alphaproteobacteria bacterium]
MKYSSRFFLYAPLSLFLTLFLGVGVHWWLAASALSKQLEALNGSDLAPGVTMRFSSRTISGFPFTLDTVFRGTSFRIDTPHGPAEWRPQKFAMHTLTYGRAETIFEAAGRQELRWTRDDGSKRTLVFDVGALHASAIEDRTGPTRFDLDLVGFGSKAFTAQRLQLHIRRDLPRDALDLVVSADGVRFSAADSPNLGNQVAKARFEGVIGKAAAFDALLAGAERWTDAVERWRRFGGTLHADSFRLKWPELTASGQGTLSLDDTHRPQGTLNFKITGIAAFQEHATERRLARGPNTGLAGALLDHAAADNGEHADAVLGFADGAVSLDGEPADTVTPLY